MDSDALQRGRRKGKSADVTLASLLSSSNEHTSLNSRVNFVGRGITRFGDINATHTSHIQVSFAHSFFLELLRHSSG